MELTKKEALRLCVKLWRWLSETGRQKAFWPGWEINGGKYSEINSDCFLCEYIFQVTDPNKAVCYSCPLIDLWGIDDNDNNCPCMWKSSPYYKWYISFNSDDRKKYAKEIADFAEAEYNKLCEEGE